MVSSNDILLRVKDALAQLNLNGKPDELYKPIAYTMAGGGKRIRPVLTLLSCDMFGGNLEKAIYPAISLEIFHNFTLVHDDIMDNAPIRRGKETVFKKWDANIAILSGDTMFALAYKYLIQTDRKFLPGIIEIFTDAAIGVCEGQQLDMNYESTASVTIDDYIRMIQLKTAVLLAASIKTGAAIAEADVDDIEKMYQFGINMGIAFQLQDDLLDVYGDQDKFGKQIGNDIVTNKKTFLILKALELADTKDKSDLLDYFASTNFNAEVKIQKVRSIYDKYAIKETTTDLINSYYSKAVEYLRSTSIPEEKKIVFRTYSDNLMQRDF